MAISQTIIGHEQASHLVRDRRWTRHVANSSPAVAVARTVALLGLAAFAILVLLPAIVGAAV